jgi:hypothetical protein
MEEAAVRPPPHEVPGAVPLTLVLGRTREFAIVLTDLAAYSNGLLFTTSLAIKDAESTPLLDDWATTWLPAPTDRDFQLSIEYGDGRRFLLRSSPGSSAHPVRFQRGWSDANMDSRTAFISPLPERGGVTFTCAWPSRGLGPQTRNIGPAPILDATRRILRLWQDAEDDSEDT